MNASFSLRRERFNVGNRLSFQVEPADEPHISAPIHESPLRPGYLLEGYAECRTVVLFGQSGLEIGCGDMVSSVAGNRAIA